MSNSGQDKTEPLPFKGRLAIDPRGLIYEAYRIEGITEAECRTIFLDWAINVPAGRDLRECTSKLHAEYGPQNADHPMTRVLVEGTGEAQPPRRRGGRLERRRNLSASTDGS